MARRSIVVFVVALATLPCLGQRHSGIGVGSLFHHHPFGRRRSDFPGAYLLGDPFFWYGDDPAPQGTAEPGPPVLILRPETSAQARLTPLLIELEGGRYVRHGGTSQATPREVSGEPRTSQAAKSDSRVGDQSAQLAPTILVFRDGHSEQVPDYAIVGRVLYAHGDFDGEPGYGLKNIQLSELDIATTIRRNRENGVNFVLPSG